MVVILITEVRFDNFKKMIVILVIRFRAFCVLPQRGYSMGSLFNGSDYNFNLKILLNFATKLLKI